MIRLRHRLFLIPLLALCALSPYARAAIDTNREDIAGFIELMQSRHGIPADETRRILETAEVQERILEAMRRPAEKVKPWHEYRQIFMTDKRIEAGLAFWKAHEATLARVQAETGVPAEIIVGILGVETLYGRIKGSHRVVDALVTLAFEYPPRSKFFTSELEQFLLLTREQDIDPLTATGSYAGAMGGPQFISSSYRAYAVDTSGDGKVDLWDNWEDIIGSVANYFSRHGWRPGQPVFARLSGDPGDWAMSDGLKLDKSVSELRDDGMDVDPTGRADDEVMIFSLEEADGPSYLVGYRNFYVITRYNRSNKYAMAVFELGQAVRARFEQAADAS